MKIDKLEENKIQAYVTVQDLEKRGLDVDSIFEDEDLLKDLLDYIIEHAIDLYGFEAFGPLGIDVVDDMPDNIIITITRVTDPDFLQKHPNYQEDECNCINCLMRRAVESQNVVDLMESEGENALEENYLLVRLKDIEHVIPLAQNLLTLGLSESRFFHYQNHYYLSLDDMVLEGEFYKDVKAIITEYGQISKATTHVLEEYGKVICASEALETITKHFK